VSPLEQAIIPFPKEFSPCLILMGVTV